MDCKNLQKKAKKQQRIYWALQVRRIQEVSYRRRIVPIASQRIQICQEDKELIHHKILIVISLYNHLKSNWNSDIYGVSALWLSTAKAGTSLILSNITLGPIPQPNSKYNLLFKLIKVELEDSVRVSVSAWSLAEHDNNIGKSK